jgi:membrane-associated protease RseP (regulator of RpoE activity)
MALVLVFLLIASADGAGVPLATIPFEFECGMIFVPVSINGGPPSSFILDSGASGFVVDAGAAREGGLDVEGSGQGEGAGKGKVDLRFAKDVSYRIGVSLQIDVPSSYVIDLSGQPAIVGRTVGGIVGYDFFVAHVVEIDYEAEIMRVFDRGSYRYDGEGAVLPLTFARKVPYVAATILVAGVEPVVADFLVDTGSGDAVDHDIIAKSNGKKLDVVGGVGLGEEYRVTMGRVESLRLGTLELRDAIGVAGGKALLGNEVLRRFTVVLDYGSSRLILAPNAHFADRFESDASGLDLRWDPAAREFLVHDVHRDSPAARAGIQPGDRIVSVDGEPAGGFTIDQITRMLRVANRSATLRLRRGDESMTRVLATATRL